MGRGCTLGCQVGALALRKVGALTLRGTSMMGCYTSIDLDVVVLEQCETFEAPMIQ